MDYLPRVSIEPVHFPVDVPFLISRRESPDTNKTNGEGEEPTQGSPPAVSDVILEDTAAFVQRKLFFNTLHDIIGMDPDLEEHRFITDSAKIPYTVTAVAVPTILKRWEAKLSASKDSMPSTRKTDRRLRKAKAVLESTMRRHCQNLNYAVRNSKHDPLSPVILSTQALLETLWDAHLTANDQHCNRSVDSGSALWIENKFVNHLLIKAGWRPNEIELMPRNIRFRYYLSFFKQRPARSLRRASSISRVIMRERYSASHLEESCDCSWLKTTLPRTDELQDSCQLVSLASNEASVYLRTRSMPLHSTAERLRFVAFSHVRSDGLGSSTANSLPACQLVHLQKLSNELLPDVQQPVPFYIDTLCVPLGGEAKRHALRNIKVLFEMADKVLVLDSDLRRTRSGLPQEDLTRIRISVWMKRLWTVQECAVSRDVYFRFEDRNVALSHLLKAYDTGDEFPLLRTQSLKDRLLNGHVNDLGHLPKALALLSDDMQLAESLRHDASSSEARSHVRTLQDGYDKWKLRRILRLGHLALPQMRYFPEPNESTEFQAVVTTILAEYNNMFLEPEAETPFSVGPEHVFARLKRVQLVKLQSDSQSMPSS